MTTMPYNTRRKSLSLPMLGIQLPNTSRAHRSNSKSNTPPTDTPLPPAKRMKRSHEDIPTSPQSPKSEGARRVIEQTPPPSPGNKGVRRIDTEGINDDIVIAVIEQLELTGNRPHLIKDLAAILASTNSNIARSANAPALLSMRLNSYLKRQWTALAPCPLAKETIPVHPRRIFFYLTSQPRGPLPDPSQDSIKPELKRLTPSISDPSVEEDEEDRQDRGRLSPSPEVELYSQELDHGSPVPSTPGESFSGRSSMNHEVVQDAGHHRDNRVPSLPLEADEKGFTETATAVRARGMSLRDPVVQPSMLEEKKEEMSPEMRQNRDREELFGNLHLVVRGHDQKLVGSSPMLQAHVRGSREAQASSLLLDEVEVGLAGWNLMSPEKIDIEELDGMFEEYESCL